MFGEAAAQASQRQIKAPTVFSRPPDNGYSCLGSNEVCSLFPLFSQNYTILRPASNSDAASANHADSYTGAEMMGEHDESAQKSPFVNDGDVEPSTRTVPILTPTIQTSAPSPGDPMDVTSPTMATMGPPSRSSPEPEANGTHDHGGILDDQGHAPSMLGPNAAVAAQAGAQQPKVVQTAFIHKLYKYVLY